MSLARRSVTSVSWNVGANLIKIAILLARSVFLARLLPVEIFGIYALATAIVTFTGILPNWGMGSAFLHRSPETVDETHAAAVHFTLRLTLTTVWAIILIVAATILAEDLLRLALITLTLVFAGLYLTDTPKAILTRRVEHRRLALLDLGNAIVTTIVAIGLAIRGYGLTALLATDVATLLLSVTILYLWQPVWRPRLVWARDTVRYYLRFGSRAMTESMLAEAIDNVDDLWTGAFLGNTALGFYSRAYTFATYPRRLLAMPVNMVAGGAYSELKSDRAGLSKAFFRTNALLVRSGFLLGGFLILVAPELIPLALGERWRPMVPAFQLLAVFTLLDPIRTTVSSLFIAVGRPEAVIRTRIAQLATLIIGLYVLSRLWGINGVALAVDGVLLIGLGLLLPRARAYVDFSMRRLFGAPLIALVSGGIAGLGALRLACAISDAICASLWWAGIVKGAAFLGVAVGFLLILEREEAIEMAQRLRNTLKS